MCSGMGTAFPASGPSIAVAGLGSVEIGPPPLGCTQPGGGFHNFPQVSPTITPPAGGVPIPNVCTMGK